ncbi:hypothetical protein [Yaniella flava]
MTSISVWPNLAQAVRARFAEIGGTQLETPSRTEMPRPADLPEQL